MWDIHRMWMKRCWLGLKRPKVGEWRNAMWSMLGIGLNMNSYRSRFWMRMKRMLWLGSMGGLGMRRLVQVRLRHCGQGWQHLSDAGHRGRGGGGGVMGVTRVGMEDRTGGRDRGQTSGSGEPPDSRWAVMVSSC